MTYNLNKKDRFMVWESKQIVFDVTNLLKSLKYIEGATNNPQNFVYERVYC